MAYVITLTAEDIEFGERFTNELKRVRFLYRGVLWLFDEDSDDWKLIVATEVVDRAGPRDTYVRLTSVAKQLNANSFQMLRISAMSPRQPIYAALQSVFGSASSVWGARLRNTVVNGLRIAEAYLYEVK